MPDSSRLTRRRTRPNYSYDTLNRLHSVSRNDGYDIFGYDYTGQLTSASYQWNNRSVAYALDPAGNRLSNSDAGGYARNGSYLNQYTAGPGGAVSNGSEHEITGYGGISYSHYADTRLRESKPNVRAIVASGYLEPGLRFEMLQAGVIDTIQKPYEFDDMLEKVRAVLGAVDAQKEDDHPRLF